MLYASLLNYLPAKLLIKKENGYIFIIKQPLQAGLINKKHSIPHKRRLLRPNSGRAWRMGKKFGVVLLKSRGKKIRIYY